jgi:serine/threonine protein kinase
LQDYLKLVGKKIGTCFIQEPLAKGGYGYSYLGYDSEIRKNRVVKVSKSPVKWGNKGDNELSNFKREGIILSRLQHTQIVPMMEQGEAFGYRYMVMDFINGFDLKKVLTILHNREMALKCQWRDLMDVPTALALILSALEPLSYAHSAKMSIPDEEDIEGLAHRDIAPGNLILGNGHEFEGKVYLIDFGTVKTNINITSTMNIGIVGSVKYMSPMRLIKDDPKNKNELFWKNFKQTQHDVHAMGCLLWELLTGNAHIGADGQKVHQCLSDISSIATYQNLYDVASEFETGIQQIIRKSIIHPDLSNSKFQYKNAAQMKEDVEKVYIHLSGNVSCKDVLQQLAKEMENPSEIVSRPEFSRGMICSKTSKVKTGMKLKKFSTRSFLIMGMICLVCVSVAFLLYLRTGTRELYDSFEEIELTSEEQIRNDINTNTIIKNDSLPKAEPKRTQLVPRKKIKISRSKRLQSDYNTLMNLVKTNQINKAYEEVKRLTGMYTEPALLIVKADLIKRKNPQSDQINKYLVLAKQMKSQLLSDKKMEEMIGNLMVKE